MSFDAVIEGKNPRDITYKVATLGVPQGISAITDRANIYKLIGRIAVTGMGPVINPEASRGPVYAKPRLDLSMCDGLTLPFDGTFTSFLGEPRTVFVDDGRVFTKMGSDEAYAQLVLPEASEVTVQLFNDRHLRAIYEGRFLQI